MKINTKEYVYVNVDSAQAEARVIFLLADDEEALTLIDTIDYHALTATWFFGENKELFNYDKKKLGYECSQRFGGKTLRHACHLGAGKRRAAISVNNDARKYGIDIRITEAIAEKALKIFHARQPKIQGVFQQGVIDCLKETRVLIAGLPYGVDAPAGGRRMFFERWGDELFRQGFSYIPQRSVSDNTKAAAMRTKKVFPECKIILEAHDGLLFSIRREYLNDFTPIIKKEMERPINFTACSLRRRYLRIPAEIEVGENYMDLKKFQVPKVQAPMEDLKLKESTLEEKMLEAAVKLPKEEYNFVQDKILQKQMSEGEKRNAKFIVG